MLAGNVPQCLVNAGNGGHVDETASPEALMIHLPPDLRNIQGILSDHTALGQSVDAGSHCVLLCFHRGFAPAHQAGIGFNFHKQPVLAHSVN